MILFFHVQGGNYIAVSSTTALNNENIDKLKWIFGNAELIEKTESMVGL